MNLREELIHKMRIPSSRIDEINEAIFNPDQQVIDNFLAVVTKYGSPDEINARATEAGKLSSLEAQVKETRPEYLEDLSWLHQQLQNGSFIRVSDYRRKVLGDNADAMTFREETPVTLEISACQYFPWLMDIARRAAENGEIMPARFIRVRDMKEQEADGDLAAFAAAMQIIGASYVEQLDTRGSDGANIHLGGADTLIGYYGGVGQPNEYALKWLDEYLYFYTNYGVRQVLNVNNGTVLLGYLLYRIGVDIEFKISVTLGNDNPYNALWTLLAARLFARDDPLNPGTGGSTPLVGFNWSNSVTNETIEISAQFRKSLGLEELVRFEHHVTETWKDLVIQPYLRREEVLALAEIVPNISAKHEGGEPHVEALRQHPSEIMDYFRTKDEILASGDWEHLTLNFHDKFDSLNLTARALTERGLSFVAAKNLHLP
jgi:hypothetical protein